METTELYWLAGLLEGEGSFVKCMPSSPNRPAISLEMTDLDVIKKVSILLGCSYATIPPKREHWKQSYKILFRGKKAIALMNSLRPLMFERRKMQIDNALASYDENRMNRFLDSCRNRRKLTESNVSYAINEMENGSSLRAAAKQLKVHHESLRRAIQKINNGGS